MGLLFAGGNTIAVANPIEEVLTYLNDALKLAPNTLQFVGAAGAGAATLTSLAQSPGVTRAAEVKAANADRLEAVPGGVGHAVALQAGVPVITVFVETITAETRRAVPARIDGVTVVLEAVGPIVAF